MGLPPPGYRINRIEGPQYGFFIPVIPTQNFVQSRNPDSYFWHLVTGLLPTSYIDRAVKIPDPDKPY